MSEKKQTIKTKNHSTGYSASDYLTSLSYFLLLAGTVMVIACLFPISLPLAAAKRSEKRSYSDEEKARIKEAWFNQAPDPAIEANAKFYPEDMKQFLRQTGLLRQPPEKPEKKPKKTTRTDLPKPKNKKSMNLKKVENAEQNQSIKQPPEAEDGYTFILLSITTIIAGLSTSLLYYCLPKKTNKIEAPNPTYNHVNPIEEETLEEPTLKEKGKNDEASIVLANSPILFPPIPKPNDVTDQAWLNQQMSFLSLGQACWFESEAQTHYELKLEASEYKGIPKEEIKQLILSLFSNFHIQAKHEGSSILQIEKVNFDRDPETELPFQPHHAISLRKNLINKTHFKNDDIRTTFVLYANQLFLNFQFKYIGNLSIKDPSPIDQFLKHCQIYGNAEQLGENTIEIDIQHLKNPMPKLIPFTSQTLRAKSSVEQSNSSLSSP